MKEESTGSALERINETKVTYQCHKDHFLRDNLGESTNSEAGLSPDPVHRIATDPLDLCNKRALRLIINRTCEQNKKSDQNTN
jgi:hypothetical protein